MEETVGSAFPISRIVSGVGRGPDFELESPVLRDLHTFETIRRMHPVFSRLADVSAPSGVTPILSERDEIVGLFVPISVRRDQLMEDIAVPWETVEALRQGVFDALWVTLNTL